MEEQDEALPDVPTESPPGSAEKIAELGGRAERGQALWHPLASESGLQARKNKAQHVLPQMRGIKWRHGSWVVSFRRRGRQIHVGTFRDYGDAVRALENAKREADNTAG